jgi:hypothetical protein
MSFRTPAFRALASTIVPEAARLDEKGWDELAEIVEKALADRPAAVKRQLGALVSALQWMPVGRWARPFTALDEKRRARFLASVENAPVLLLRRGFWGLRTLVFMGYYARPEAAKEIGYRADPKGWEARG